MLVRAQVSRLDDAAVDRRGGLLILGVPVDRPLVLALLLAPLRGEPRVDRLTGNVAPVAPAVRRHPLVVGRDVPLANALGLAAGLVLHADQEQAPAVRDPMLAPV